MTVHVASNPISGDGGLAVLEPDGVRVVAAAAGLGALVPHPALPLLYGLARPRADVEEVRVWDVSAPSAPRLLRTAVLDRGTEACAAAVVGDVLVVAHYDSGHVTAVDLDRHGLPTEQRSARLSGHGPDPERQEGSHPHHVLVRGATVVVTDLGADRLWTLDPQTLEVLGAVSLPPGTGPRHAAVLPGGDLVVSGELDETVTRVAPRGPLPALASTRRTAASRNYPSDIAVHPSGVVVVANRGADSLATFAPSTSSPAAPEGLEARDEVDAGGAWPLNLELVGDDLYATDRDADLLVAFRLDPGTGRLTPTGRWSVPRPTWVTAGPPAVGTGGQIDVVAALRNTPDIRPQH